MKDDSFIMIVEAIALELLAMGLAFIIAPLMILWVTDWLPIVAVILLCVSGFLDCVLASLLFVFIHFEREKIIKEV